MLVLISLAATSIAYAQPITVYQGPANGQFETAANWTLGVPNAGSDAEIAPGGTQEAGNLTLTVTESSNQAAAGLFIGSGFDPNDNDATVPGTVNFLLSTGNTLTLGQSFADGIEVTNQATLNFTGGTILLDNGDVDIGENISNILQPNLEGLGTFNINGGTLNLTTNNFLVGDGSNGSSIGFVTQNNGSTVSAFDLEVGSNGGIGTYTLNSGTLTLSDQILVAEGAGSIGTFNQYSNVTVTTGNSDFISVGEDGAGTYNIYSGTLTANGDTIVIGDDTGATGLLVQKGGVIQQNTASHFEVGNDGNGTYDLAGGQANLLGGVKIGALSGHVGTGVINQTGGILVVGTTGTSSTGLVVGGGGSGGTGAYNLSGGTATLNEGGTVASNGTITQTGGQLNVILGQSLKLTSAGGLYSLNGGVLDVGNNGVNGLTGTSAEGVLNFGGGTLMSEAGSTATLTDPFNATVTGMSTLNAYGSNIAFTGSLTGVGGFIIEDTNPNATGNLVTIVAHPSAASLYQGPTIINGGNLAISAPDATDIFQSSISGTTGTLQIQSAGTTLELTGTTDFTGNTTLGTTNTSTLEVFNNGTLGNVAGVGGLETEGAGTFNLVGSNTYTGPTTINVNTTLLANSLDSTTVTNSGTIGSNAAVGTPFYIGTPSGMNGSGTLNDTAGMNAASPSVMIERVQGTSAVDTYRVGAGGSTVQGDVTVQGYSALGTNHYAFITAPSASINELGQVSTQTALLLTSVTTTPNFNGPTTGTTSTVYLNVNQLPISTYAVSPNEMAIANSLDGALVNPAPGLAIFTAIDSLTAAQIPQALDSLVPVNYLYMRDIAFENSTFLSEKLDGFLGNLRSGYSGLDTSGISMVSPGMDSSLGRSLSSLLAFNNQGAAPNGVNYYPVDGDSPVSPVMEPTLPGVPEGTPTAPGSISDTPVTGMTPTASPPPPSTIFDGLGKGFNEFVSGDIILGDLNENGANSPTPKAKYTAGDATAGISFRLTSNLAVGVLFDYNHTDATVDSVNSHIHEDTYSPGVFASFFEKGFYANGLFSFGYNDYSNTRNISFGGTSSTANSSPNGEQYVADLDGGYDFHPDQHWVLGPTLGVVYTHLDVDSFNETGAGSFDESIGSQSADSLRGRIGGHVVYQLQAGDILFQPNLTLAFQREFLNDSFGLTGTPDIPGATAFTIQGTNPGRNSALIGVGATATLDNSMCLFLNYLAEVGGDDYIVQSVEGGLKASF
jgi:uncharacterized protein YhjY with autotransporter beta-barrel domain